MSWGISDKATEKENIFAEFNDSINGLNCVGEIDYDAYSQIYDLGRALADREYEQGKADERRKFAEWLQSNGYYVYVMSTPDGIYTEEVTVDEIISAYEKEQMKGEQT